MGMHITSVFNLNTGATAVAEAKNKKLFALSDHPIDGICLQDIRAVS